MKSIGFPNIIKVNSTNIIKDHDATLSNLKLLLMSEKGELFGDPYFGLNLKTFFFNQNSKPLKDIIIDDIYTAIKLFMPQLTVNRSDIILTKEEAKLKVLISAINNVDFKTDLYNIVLFQEDEER